MIRKASERWVQKRAQFITKVLKTVAAVSISGLETRAHGADNAGSEYNWWGRLLGATNLRRGTSSWVTDYLGDNPLYPL